MTRTLDLDRAKDSMGKVTEILDDGKLNEEWKDQYAGYVESLPAAIVNCGLGQAAATLLAAAKKKDGNSAKDPHYVLYEHLQGWLCRPASSDAPYRGADKLMQAITAGDRNAYIHARAEALKWLEWHKKLAVAYLKKPKAGDQS